jgi:membrane AbrB-like protein
MLLAAVALGAMLASFGLPAPFLMSSMLASAVFAWHDAHVRIPVCVTEAAQAIVGVFIASKIALGIEPQLIAYLPWFGVVTLATLVFCGLLGIALTRGGSALGSSAIWGLSPGAATAMIIMAGEFGANRQMVALMQYTRVVFVVLSSIAVVGMGKPRSPLALLHDIAHVDTIAILVTLAIVVLSLILARWIKWPAAQLLYPMLIGTLTMKWFGTAYSPPLGLMVMTYVVLGIRIGGGFSKDLVLKFRSILGRLILTILALIAFSLASSWIFTSVTGIDFRTAYMAFAPGGLDTAALIAGTSGVNMHLVMASQSMRMLIVIAVCPWMTKFIVRRFALM